MFIYTYIYIYIHTHTHMIPERGPQTAFPTQSMGWNVWGATYGTQPTYGVQPLGGPHSEPQTSTTDAGTAQGHSFARDTA